MLLPIWGQDGAQTAFRPAFGQLYRLRVRLPTVPIIALTATDPPEVRAHLTRLLALREPRLIETAYSRANFYYKVIVERVKGRRLDIIVELAAEFIAAS